MTDEPTGQVIERAVNEAIEHVIREHEGGFTIRVGRGERADPREDARRLPPLRQPGLLQRESPLPRHASRQPS